MPADRVWRRTVARAAANGDGLPLRLSARVLNRYAARPDNRILNHLRNVG